MGGGLMQLVAYGAQDIYLTGNPQITFFKVVYRRHTNFSMEAVQQSWTGEESSTTDTVSASSIISRSGDLLHKIYLEISGTQKNQTISSVTGICIKEVELLMGGNLVDRHTGNWMNVWAHLTEPNPTGHVGQSNTLGGGDGTLFQNMSGLGGLQGINNGTTRFFVPLYFWFSRNPGLALPMIALQYNDVEIRIKTNFGLAYDTKPTNNLWTDFIYLDTDERRRFAEGEHEYLIEQLQEQTMNTGNATTTLNFNYPVKELIWCVDGTATDQVQTAIGSNDSTYVLKLNGHERFEARDFRYFSRVQILDHHSGAGGLTQNAGAATGKFSDGIGVYSFALNPEEHQPSGTCNFSRIDSAEIVGSSSDCVATRIYAINYNVLRIISGRGNLAYSN